MKKMFICLILSLTFILSTTAAVFAVDDVGPRSIATVGPTYVDDVGPR